MHATLRLTESVELIVSMIKSGPNFSICQDQVLRFGPDSHWETTKGLGLDWACLETPWTTWMGSDQSWRRSYSFPMAGYTWRLQQLGFCLIWVGPWRRTHKTFEESLEKLSREEKKTLIKRGRGFERKPWPISWNREGTLKDVNAGYWSRYFVVHALVTILIHC